MGSQTDTGPFICHLTAGKVAAGVRIRAQNAPAWARAAGISWRAARGSVTPSRRGEQVRLVLKETTGDAREIEWDPGTAQAVLRRSELWSKPFYFHLTRGALTVSDSLRLICQTMHEPPQTDPQALDAYLALEFFPAPLTPFRGIEKVGVEETCHLNLNSVTRKWVTNPLPVRSPGTLAQGLDAVDEALGEAVRRRTQQCTEDSVLFCSGGLDSTLLAHFMEGRGQAIVLSYPDSWKDEVQPARRAAAHAHLPLREICLPVFNSDRFCKYVDLLDEPLGGTCGYATRQLCAAVRPGAWIFSGHGTGTLSLMNFNHKHLRDALPAGAWDRVEQHFSRNVSYLPRETRQRLLGNGTHPGMPDPVLEMLRREWPSQQNRRRALEAVIRRQLCVSEETTQFWPIYEAFGHTPVMPFFERRVRAIMDRLPPSVLRTARYERRLLGALVKRHCPGYVRPPQQLGYGLPLGLAAYPNEHSLQATLARFSKGPLCEGELARMLASGRQAKDGEKFFWLRRLWSAMLLHAWLARNQTNCLSFQKERTV